MRLVNMCPDCYERQRDDCMKKEHKIRLRFVGNQMTSFEEFSPDIASFGLHQPRYKMGN